MTLKDASSRSVTKSEILIFLESVKKRPGMYVQDYQSYDGVTAYLGGYFMCLCQLYRQLFSPHVMSIWYHQINKDSKGVILLSAAIKNNNSDLSEEQLIRVYIETVIDYVKARG